MVDKSQSAWAFQTAADASSDLESAASDLVSAIDDEDISEARASLDKVEKLVGEVRSELDEMPTPSEA